LKDLTQLRQEAQQTLIEFLTSDLDLCFTFVRLAQQHEDDEDCKQLVQNARKGMDAIRRFEGRIGDVQIWGGIHERADKLDLLLSAFPSS
jgi:hypothetical protein